MVNAKLYTVLVYPAKHKLSATLQFSYRVAQDLAHTNNMFMHRGMQVAISSASMVGLILLVLEKLIHTRSFS